MYNGRQIGDREMTKTRLYEIKENYFDIQIDEVNKYNKAIIELNEIIEMLNTCGDSGELINYFNKKVELQKEHMKTTKPNWLKR